MLEGKTVIFGGSFNPPHAAHQMICLYLIENLGADEVWMVPANSHPLGKELIEYHHRAAMCRMVAESLSSRVMVCDAEKKLAGKGRTFDLLTHLIGEHPKRSFSLAVGADILLETQKWHRWDDITEMVQVLILGRSGYDNEAAGKIVPAGELELPKVSSSEIRRRLRAQESVGGLISLVVKDYIVSNGLYQV